MLGATAAAIVLAPLLLPVAAVRDLVRGKRALPTVRGYLFALQYVVNDSIEIVAAGPLWMAAGFGRRLDGDASQRRHERLQAWSIRAPIAVPSGCSESVSICRATWTTCSGPALRSWCAATSACSTPRFRRCSISGSGSTPAGW
ncbi:MAG: hypothetical protein R2705_08505 [Ilumatobacteraceae bacterium]